MRLICAAMLAALTAACGPGATDSHNSSQAGATPRGGAEQPAHEQAVMLTGCLQDADRNDEAAAAGTSGSAGRRGSAGSATDQMAAGRGSPGERFTLTHARNGAGGDVAGSYVLEGNLEALRGHVDREVRVKGTLDTGAANTAGPRRVRVDSVEPVGDRCAP